MVEHQTNRPLFRVLPVNSGPVDSGSIRSKPLSLLERVVIGAVALAIVVGIASACAGHWIWLK